MKSKLLIVFILLSLTLHSQQITVRKKYLDSIKNQLAIYTTETFTLLNENERCLNDNKRLGQDVQDMKNLFYYQEEKINTQFRIFGSGFIVVLGVFVYGLIKIIK
jgi:hypothetical protein